MRSTTTSRYTPRDLFTDELAKDNFLQLSLFGFFETIGDRSLVGPVLAREAAALDAFLLQRFGWSAQAPSMMLGAEGSEWGPTVVSDDGSGDDGDTGQQQQQQVWCFELKSLFDLFHASCAVLSCYW